MGEIFTGFGSSLFTGSRGARRNILLFGGNVLINLKSSCRLCKGIEFSTHGLQLACQITPRNRHWTKVLKRRGLETHAEGFGLAQFQQLQKMLNISILKTLLLGSRCEAHTRCKYFTKRLEADGTSEPVESKHTAEG